MTEQHFESGSLTISGTLIRDAGDEQVNESALIMVDQQEFAYYDVIGSPEMEEFGPITIDVEAGEHAIIIRHVDDSDDPQSPGSIIVQFEILFVGN